MNTVICQPGESVFEATERGVSEGAFPVGSQPILLGGIGSAHPTCESQVGVVQVRRNERFAVTSR